MSRTKPPSDCVNHVLSRITLHRNSFSRTLFARAHLFAFFRNFETVAERKKRKRVNNMRKDKIQRSRDRKANENKF